MYEEQGMVQGLSGIFECFRLSWCAFGEFVQ